MKWHDAVPLVGLGAIVAGKVVLLAWNFLWWLHR